MLKKLVALLTVLTLVGTMMVTVPVSAAKGSPAVGNTTNVGHNYYQQATNVNKGTPWIVFADAKDVNLGTETEPFYAAKMSATSSVSQVGVINTMFHTFYTPSGNIYQPTGTKYAISFDFMASQTNTQFKMLFMDRGDITAANGNTAQARVGMVDINEKGQIALYTGGTSTHNDAADEKYATVDYDANKWYSFSIVSDTSTGAVDVYIDSTLLGSINYKELYENDSWYGNSEGVTGLIPKILVQAGNETGWVDSSVTDITSSALYVRNIGQDYVTDANDFYGTAVLDGTNNKIDVTFSTSPKIFDPSKVVVKKADGTVVDVESKTLNSNVLSIKLKKYEAATEYVVCLPSDLATRWGKKIYSTELFVTAPIRTTDVEYIFEENFETNNYVLNDTESDFPDFFVAVKLPTAKNSNDISIAYRTENGVSDNVVEGATKCLKDSVHAWWEGGFAFNLPTPAVNDFTIEFDMYVPNFNRKTNYVSGGYGWMMNTGAGKLLNGNNGNFTVTKLDGTTKSAQQKYAFGMTHGDYVGAPNFSANPENGAWSTRQSEYTYNDAPKVKWEHFDAWHTYKIETTVASQTESYVTAYIDGNKIGKWKNNYNFANAELTSAPQLGWISFLVPGPNGVYRDENGVNKDGNVRDAMSIYLDNLKVYVDNRKDARVETVTVTDEENSESFGAVSTGSDTIKTIAVKFSNTCNLLPDSITTSAFSLTDSKGEKISFTLGSYDGTNKQIALTTEEFLKVGESYTLTVDGIKHIIAAENTHGAMGAYYEIPTYSAQINVTDKGEFIITNLAFAEVDGNNVLKATVKNTLEDKKVTSIIANYNSEVMSGVTLDENTIDEGFYGTYTFASTLPIDSSATGTKGFLWDSITNIKPLIENIAK